MGVHILEVMLERVLSLIPKKPDGKFVHGAKKDFSKNIGAPENIVSDWISGRSSSYKNYAYQISAKYGVSVEWLRGETDKKEKPASEEAGFHPTLEDWLNAIDRMSREEMRAVMSRVMERYAGEDK